ncbi:hypothetical protein LTR95_004716 [Oleoguttula sp. CCFEE 5521]
MTSMSSQELQDEIARLATPAEQEPNVAYEKQPASEQLRRYIDAQYAAHGKKSQQPNIVCLGDGVDYRITSKLTEAFGEDMFKLPTADMVAKYSLLPWDSTSQAPSEGALVANTSEHFLQSRFARHLAIRRSLEAAGHSDSDSRTPKRLASPKFSALASRFLLDYSTRRAAD